MSTMGNSFSSLFSQTQARVLAVLFGQPERSFYATEIIRLAQSGSGAVQRELERLLQANLVTVRKMGNQKHYQANREAPIFEELRSIVLKTFGLAGVLQSALQPIWKDIELAFVYGSLAKGTERANSDIDLLVIGSQLSHAQLLGALRPASGQLGRPVNPVLYTVDEFQQRIQEGKSFVLRVMEQPKIFVKGSENDVSRFTHAGEFGAPRTLEA